MSEKSLPFRLEDYEQRLARLRDLMGARGLEVMLFSSQENVFYFSGYHSLEPASAQAVLAVPLQGAPFLLIRRINLRLAKLTSWVEDIEFHADADGPERVVETLQARSWAGKVIGAEARSPSCTAGLYLVLQEGLARLQDGSGLAEALRRIKSPAEVACIEAAARMTDAGMTAVFDTLRPGVTDSDLAAAAYAAMVRAGSGALPLNPIIAAGPLAGVTHANFSGRTLSSGDPVFVHLAASHRHYCAPLQRLMVVGEAPERWREVSRAAHAAQAAALARMRPGVAPAEVVEAGRVTLAAAGLDRFGRNGGPSIGVGFQSYAESSVGALSAADTAPLAAGMCFHATVGLQPKGLPVICAADLVVIEPTGPRILGATPRRLMEARLPGPVVAASARGT
jgi:Xaa-Pro dipeptidase